MPRFKLILVRNPKTASSFFVARVNLEKEELEFVKPKMIEYDERGRYRIGGEYEFEVNDFIIVKYDHSSHKNIRQTYVLYRVGNELKELAKIEVYNKAKEFTPDELREIYSAIENGKGKIVKTLVKYAKKIAKEEMNKEDIFREMLYEIRRIIEKYEEKLSGYIPYDNIKNQVEATLKSMEG